MDDEKGLEPDDSMTICLSYFEDAARTVAGGPERAMQQFEGHFAAAWELRQELLAGAALMGWKGVTEGVQRCIERLVSAAEALPRGAFAGNSADELLHAGWTPVREAANEFLAAGVAK